MLLLLLGPQPFESGIDLDHLKVRIIVRNAPGLSWCAVRPRTTDTISHCSGENMQQRLKKYMHAQPQSRQRCIPFTVCRLIWNHWRRSGTLVGRCRICVVRARIWLDGEKRKLGVSKPRKAQDYNATGRVGYPIAPIAR